MTCAAACLHTTCWRRNPRQTASLGRKNQSVKPVLFYVRVPSAETAQEALKTGALRSLPAPTLDFEHVRSDAGKGALPHAASIDGQETRLVQARLNSSGMTVRGCNTACWNRTPSMRHRSNGRSTIPQRVRADRDDSRQRTGGKYQVLRQPVYERTLLESSVRSRLCKVTGATTA